MKTINRFANKKDALTAALQAGAARDLAVAKSRRQFKRTASGKKAYKPGNLGPSAVATAIKKMMKLEYKIDAIPNRQQRKSFARLQGKPFQKFYAQG
ncbi:hypothetical protein D3C74_188940 [compost metagenome]